MLYIYSSWHLYDHLNLELSMEKGMDFLINMVASTYIWHQHISISFSSSNLQSRNILYFSLYIAQWLTKR